MDKANHIGSKILLVEDEETLAMGLEFNLKEEGYEVTWVKDGNAALKTVFEQSFDLIILDIMLPYLNGFEVAKRIRAKYPQMPILMLTARTQAADRIHGLEVGADDYLTKPFHLEELLLRVRGMLRRKAWYQSGTPESVQFRFGPNTVNFETLVAQTAEHRFRLTLHEAMLLKYLIDHRGKVVSRIELLKNVWNINSEVETRTVDIFISRLRKYFEKNPRHPRYLKSIRGIGYMFDP